MNSGHSDEGKVFVCPFCDWRNTVRRLLDGAGLAKRLVGCRTVLIKPNLVEARKPPVTTPVNLVAALLEYLREEAPTARLIVAEGNGAVDYATNSCFDALGYTALAADGIELLDLNTAPLTELARADCSRWPTMHLPRILFESFLISVPVLKAHTLAGVTLTMKNMMGVAPPAHYRQGGHWKKAAFHAEIQEAVLDLNRYRTPDFTVLDATFGMQEAHLWGPTCEPPPNRLAAGYDPVAIDAYGSGLLGRDWRKIGHISRAAGKLGTADPLRIVELG
jgi:uncharacterized protein (DUF362 family)